MRRAAVALLTSLMMVGGLLAATTGAQAATSLDKTEKRIIKLHNKARANNGVKRTLKANKCLDRFAEKQARRQAKKGTIYHQNLRRVQNKCKMSTVGENVAYGQSSAGQVHRAWMNSSGHRANILNRKYNKIGVGVARDSSGRPYYAVVFGRR